MAPASTPPPPRRAAFSAELRELAARFDGRPVQVEALLEAIGERGFHVLLVLLALPFLTPLPLPGLSVPFGFIVALVGFHFAAGLKPWLPQKLLRRELPPQFLAKLLGAASRIVNALEYVLRPRLVFLHDNFFFRRVAGVLLALSGVFLLAPLPIPFTNTLPAWTILFLAAGALERDGLFFVAGCVAFAVTTAYFALLAFGGMEVFENLRHYFVH